MAITISGDSPNFTSVAATTITNVTNISSNAADTPVILGDSGTNYNTCRAWVNFNGTGTVAIRADFNVTSITDNGTGSYTVNFTTAMPDVNYSVAGGAGTSTGGNGYRWLAVGSSQASDFSMTTTSVRVQTTYDGTNKTDAEFVGVAIFR
jgi:hypothetical protein